MTLCTIGAKQVRYRFRSYAAYFLSSAFASWLFFVYQTLLSHPGLAPHLDADDTFRAILRIVSVVIGIFSALFILYAHSAFLKLRQRELGLFAVIGLTHRQIVRTILAETLLLGLGAVTVGVLGGILGQTLMINMVGLTLRLTEPLPPYMPWSATGITYTVFGGVFAAVALASHIHLWRTPLTSSLTADRRPVPALRRSPWLALTAVLLLGWVYWRIWHTDRFDDLIYLIAAGLVGTYLLFAQALSYGLAAISRLPGVYMRGLNLLGVAQLKSRLSENTVVLFLVSTLTAAVLFLMGAGLTAQALALDTASMVAPIDIQIIGEEHGIAPRLVHESLAAEGVRLASEVHVPIIRGRMGPTFIAELGMINTSNQLVDFFISRSSAIRWLQALGHHDVAVDLPPFDGSVALMGDEFQPPPPVTPQAMRDSYSLVLPTGARLDFQPIYSETLAAVNTLNLSNLHRMILVSDETFDRWRSEHPGGVTTLSAYYTMGNPAALLPVFDRLADLGDVHALYSQKPFGDITGPALYLEYHRRGAGQMLFVFGFLGMLFFLATSQMLFFRLWTHLQEDRAQFAALNRLGVSEDQVKRLISVQSLILFFVPLAVGILNGSLLMRTVNIAERNNDYTPFIVAVMAYFSLQALYYLISRRVYVRAVLPRT